MQLITFEPFTEAICLNKIKVHGLINQAHSTFKSCSHSTAYLSWWCSFGSKFTTPQWIGSSGSLAIITLAQLYGHLSRENSTLRGFSLVSRLSALRNCRQWSRLASRGWWSGSAQPRGNTRGPKGASIRPTLHAERFIMCELTMRASRTKRREGIPKSARTGSR